MLRLGHGQERPGHRLVQPTRSRRAAHLALQLLRRGRRGPRHTIGAGQRHAFHLVDAVNAHDFLDNIGRTIHIRAPTGHSDLPVIPRNKAQSGQNALLLVRRDGDAAQRFGQPGIIGDNLGRGRRLTRAHHFGCLAAADLQHQTRQQIEAGVEEGGSTPRSKRLRASEVRFSLRPVAAMRSG
jgi:hypothetical protein